MSFEQHWDRERVRNILTEHYKRRDADAVHAFEKLLDEIRTEAIGWTWAEACSNMDKGLDNRRINPSSLLSRAQEDLNPLRK